MSHDNIRNIILILHYNNIMYMAVQCLKMWEYEVGLVSITTCDKHYRIYIGHCNFIFRITCVISRLYNFISYLKNGIS